MKALLRASKRVVKALRSPSSSRPCQRCAPLRNENARLRKQIRGLKERIARLRKSLAEARRANKRQAAPFSKGPPKAHPKRPGRKPGKNYGRKGRRPVPGHVDETYEASLGPCCPHCGSQEIEQLRVVDQYEEEIPEVKPRRRRFRIGVGRCRRCRRRIQGRHPLQTSNAIGAANVHLGPRAKALVADLSKHVGMSFGKLSRILRTNFSLSVTRGGLSQIADRVAKALAPTYDALVQQARRAAVAAGDETGWKVGGKLAWLWVIVTRHVTVYRIMEGRGFGEARTLLGADFDGTLVRDGWAPYRQFELATHQTCIGGHLIRRLQENLETAQAGAARLPHAVLRIFERALHLRDHWLEHPPTPHGRATHVGIITSAMDRLLDWTPTDEENCRLIKHLLNEEDALFTFLKDPSVPASNYWAEQALRPPIVTRKIWGGNRTWHGAETQWILATTFRTCEQQGVDPAPIITDVLRSPLPRLAPLPSLPSGP